MTEDEMVGWHHRHNGHEFEQALGVGDGQGSLVCCSPWGCKELDMTQHTSLITELYLNQKSYVFGSRIGNPEASYNSLVHQLSGSFIFKI